MVAWVGSPLNTIIWIKPFNRSLVDYRVWFQSLFSMSSSPTREGNMISQLEFKKTPSILRGTVQGLSPSLLHPNFFRHPLGGGNSNIFLFSARTLGKMNPFWRAYFSNGLVQPPTSPLLALIVFSSFFVVRLLRGEATNFQEIPRTAQQEFFWLHKQPPPKIPNAPFQSLYDQAFWGRWGDR